MTAPKLPVSNVVNVQIEMSPKAAALRNFGACLIIGDSDVIDAGERIREYSDIASVAADFGTAATEYDAARTFFSQSPKPVTLQIGRWVKGDIAGILKGRVLSTAEQAIDRFKSTMGGTFDVMIDGTKVSVSAIDLSGESNLNGVASKITAALNSKGTCIWNGERFVISSATRGTASKVYGVTVTSLSKLMGLDTSTTAVNGMGAESLTDCLAEMLDFTTWYAAFVAADYTVEEAEAAAGIIEAAEPKRIIGFTSIDTMELDATQTTSLGAKLKAAGFNRSFVVYSSTAKSAAMSVLGRMSTVNFEGSNTTITLKFKQCPGVVAENLRTKQAKALSANNVNVFAAYQNDTSILQEGTMCGGYFIDEVHGLDWLENRVQTDVWNLLYTSKKIGQDDTGSDNIVTTVTRSLEQGVTNGLIAPGVWNGDEFGALKKGDTLSTGFYVYIQPMSEQSQSDREARKAPPTQIAAKLKGAIHFADITITVNR